MNQDEFRILLARLDVQDDKLDAIHGDFREFKGATEQKILMIQDQAKSDRLWHRIQTAGIVPIIGIFRELLRHYRI